MTKTLESFQIVKKIIGRIKQKFDMIISNRSLTEQRKNHLDRLKGNPQIKLKNFVKRLRKLKF